MKTTTNTTEKRIANFATQMGKAIARLAKTDLAAAKRMSDLACMTSEDIRAGNL